MPLGNVQCLAYILKVSDQGINVVAEQPPQRSRAATTSLVHKDNAVVNRIEKATVVGAAAVSRTTVNKKHGHAMPIATLLIINLMPVSRDQRMTSVRFNGCKQLALIWLALFPSFASWLHLWSVAKDGEQPE